MRNKELELAINNNNLKYIIALLEESDFSNECLDNNKYNVLDYALQNIYERNGSLEIVYTLLQKGINTNCLCDEKSTPLHTALWYEDWLNSEILLKYGSNPNITADETESTILASENNLDMTRILLNYGALYNLGIPNMYLGTNTLHNAVRQGNLNMIQLLLDYGADPMSGEECYMLGDEIHRDIFFDHVDISTEEFDELNRLLNWNNHPYLKIEESKYIIYENELINREGYPYAKPYLLTDKTKHKEKKYLYADNKIDLFLYWCYKKELLIESVNKAIKIYEASLGEINIKNINKLMISTLGEQLTTDSFTEDGKAFATSYLTVTHWWYNLHTDFNRLYQEESVKLPRAVKSQEEFDTLMKLLDIRHGQFKSGKDFNSNQNKEELECLIEGREPRPRHVQLNHLLI